MYIFDTYDNLENMKKPLISLFLPLLFSLTGYAQTSEVEKLNLDFEQNEKGFPLRWETFGSKDYQVHMDSVIVKKGKYSVVIENTTHPSDFKALSIQLPHNYIGKSIRLSGYIKTENVTEGYAGIWIEIAPGVALDNMEDRGITGTTDWKPYEIVLSLNPEETQNIVFGGALVGKGKMWLDDLQVSIDGKDLDSKDLEIYQRIIPAAEKDKEFDSGSNIASIDLKGETLDKLELLGRIWGFLKYHHPEIAKGNYNWDYELFRILPAYLRAKNTGERNKVLTGWVKKYGELPPCENCKPTRSDAVLKPDLAWIDHFGLSADLKSLLKEIYNNRNQGKNYYIGLHRYVANPEFKNENPYPGNPYPDSAFRLLALYRYWNMIEYFFPYKHLTDKKWNTVLKEYIPHFINAKDELAYELAALQLIGEVNDTHANLWEGGDKITKLKGSNYAPFKVEFVEGKLVVTDYYNPEHTTLNVGDIITHINGKAIKSITDSLKACYPSSNEAAMLRDISGDLLRSAQKTISLNYVSEKQNKQREIALYDKKELNMYFWYRVNKEEICFKMLEGNIGYITLATIKEADIPEIKKLFKDTRGIIIDIRNYPNTFVPFALGSYFLAEPASFAKFTEGNPYNPGEFTFRDGDIIPADENPYKGKLVVLVNEKSQSQAEYTAMAFRAAKNTTIVGSTTAGADGNVSTILLPGELSTWISGIGVYYPDGTETQRIGIVPDVTVKPTIEGIRKGKDEVLEKAIEIIHQ